MGAPVAPAAGSGAATEFLPTLGLPKGGVVVHGMGESWKVNTQTGGLSVTVPLPMSPGRGASHADLSLSYSGAGRSVYGYGWGVSLASLTRRRTTSLPRYTDDDVFGLTGFDDLVPTLTPDASGGWRPVTGTATIDGVTCTTERFRPRTDDTRTRIERCRSAPGAVPFWRVTDHRNVTRIFGRTPGARIVDPADATGQRVSEWLLEQVVDDLGNVATYEYKAEDTANVLAQPGEAHRLAPGALPQANRYLQHIRYANAVPGDASTCRILVVLDYGEHDLSPTPTRSWPARSDAYSVYSPGFEVRTYRLCRRVLVFHDFGADLGPGPSPRLVRSIELDHDAGGLSRLTSVRTVGYRWNGGSYDAAELPPLEFSYLDPVAASAVRDVAVTSRRDGAQVHLVDLDGDGLPGILTSGAGAWWYQPPAGGGAFDPPRCVRELPPTGAAGIQGMRDVDGTGRVGMAAETSGLAGTSVRLPDGSWDRYQAYRSRAVTRTDDPRARRIDLTGDGLADTVTYAADGVRWTPSLGRDGYGRTRLVPGAADERLGPVPAADDGAHEWFGADMTGDGLADLVRVRGGRVDYWPNLGWGRYGGRVTMTGTLALDRPDAWDATRIRFADLDGSGTADLLYLGDLAVTAWRNASGTSWSPPQVLAVPRVDGLAQLQVLDLLGTGGSCLVWSSSLPGAATVRYLDLAAAGPPNRLRSITTNVGARTSFDYDTSARLQLAAVRAGARWQSTTSTASLVVTRVLVEDLVSDSSMVTRYLYRDAWSDPVERESRGFGYAETWDAENLAGGLDLPPVVTKEWFATGRPGDRQRGVFSLDPQAQVLPGPERVGVTGGREYEQSARALAGRLVRTEVWVEDAGPAAPVTVTQTRLRVRQLQPADARRPSVFRVEPLESITAHYERSLDDPRVTHDLTVSVDDHGTPDSTVAVAYRRRLPQIEEQNTVLLTWTRSDLVSRDDDAAHRVSEPAATREYEVTALPVPAAGRYDVPGLTALLPTLPERDFSAPPTPGLAQRRLRAATRYEYWDDTLTAALPPGSIGVRALTRRVLRFALTPDLVTAAFAALVTPGLLAADGGYEFADGLWWAGDGVRGYSPGACYLPVQHTGPFGNTATVTWDAHHLLVASVSASTTAPLSLNTTTAVLDYATLAPRQISDPNAVVQRIGVDALGRVVATWRRAPDGTGDPDPLPGATYTYGDLDVSTGAGPCWAHAATRERHGDAASPWREQRMFLDGSGRVAMTKTSCEPGEAWASDGMGGVVVVDTTPAPRWIGSGRTVWSSKGQPAEQYEPYFATTPAFESADALVKHTQLQRRSYDALGRLLRVDHPDGTLETVTIEAWRQINGDRNDTVLLSSWYAQRQGGGAASPAEQRAAALTAAHADTPQVQLCDPLGRIVRLRVDNGADGIQETRFGLDVAGEMLEVHDARGVRVGAQLRDAAGRVIRTDSVDSGTQIAVSDAAGRQLRLRTADGDVVAFAYDLLGRPTQVVVTDASAATRLAEFTVYGEAHPQAVARGLVGQTHRRYDGAGASRAEQFDLHGDLLDGSRRLLSGSQPPDWSPLVGVALSGLDAAAAPLLDMTETFPVSGTFDALGRSLAQDYGDGHAVVLTYAGGALATVTGTFPGRAVTTTLVNGIDHDALRRRTVLRHGNGVVVTHTFDAGSGRLAGLAARAGGSTIQDLTYTYDPVGNVVQVADAAAQTTFFAGAVVAPGNLYTFDPAYRLRSAAGREHSSLGLQPNRTEPAMPGIPHPHDTNALRAYVEYYSYDSVGNIDELRHVSATSTWRRAYAYAPNTNRLMAHQLPGDADGGPYSATFDYDAGGNTVRTPYLASLAWDTTGRLSAVDLGGGGTVTYHYDGAGNRVRKIWQHPGALREERIYLGNLELYRRYLSGALVFERRTLRVLDGQRVVALVETVTLDASNPIGVVAPVVRYQYSDVQASIALECDETGAVISYEEFHPFGTTSLWLARGAAAVSLKRYRYIGREKDEETGYYAAGVRHYCCWLGRWISPDPAGLIDGVNRYAYVANNPVSRSDPSGLAGGVPVWDNPQLWLSEARAFWTDARATQSTRGFTKGLTQYLEDVAQSWGAPASWDIGHMEDPFVIQPPGTISKVGIQESRYNRSAGATIDKAAGEANEAAGLGKRVEGAWVSGPHSPPVAPITGKPPAAPTFTGVTPKPLTTGGQTAAANDAWAATDAWTPPSGPTPGAGPVEGTLPGVQTDQLSLPFDGPPAPSGSTAPPVTTPQGAPEQVELFSPAPGSGGTGASSDLAATGDLATDANAVTSSVGGAPGSATTTALAPATPAAEATSAVAKDATGVGDVTKDLAAGGDVTKDLAQAGDLAKDEALIAEGLKDASLVTDVVREAKTVESVAKTAAPVAKAVAPVVKQAGALTKVVGGVVKVAAPVVKVVAPVVKVIGEVAKPLAVGLAVVDLANAHNNTDRLVAGGDLAAGVAVYCGPVGEAFAGGYTLGGLADKGVEVASKAAFGVDLSPSNGVAHLLDAQDKLVSAVIPDDPKKPAYKNDNKLAWFLIDKLGF